MIALLRCSRADARCQAHPRSSPAVPTRARRPPAGPGPPRSRSRWAPGNNGARVRPAELVGVQRDRLVRCPATQCPARPFHAGQRRPHRKRHTFDWQLTKGARCGTDPVAARRPRRRLQRGENDQQTRPDRLFLADLRWLRGAGHNQLPRGDGRRHHYRQLRADADRYHQ